MPRQLQLSPVKESLPLQVGLEGQDDDGSCDNISNSSDSVAGDTTDSSCNSEHILDAVEDKGVSNSMNSNSSLSSDLQVIIKAENERLLMFVHFREANEEVKNTWKLIHFDLVESVKTICIRVNQARCLYIALKDNIISTPCRNCSAYGLSKLVLDLQLAHLGGGGVL
jgi:hypothetical protein